MQSTNNKLSIQDRSGPRIKTVMLPNAPQVGSGKWVTVENCLNSLKVTKHPFTTGTWNIRTLYAKGRVKELTHELECYKWLVVGLSEGRWTGCGEIVSEGHKLWFSGENKDHVNGVGFIVNKSYLSMVMECKLVSSRSLQLELAQNLKILL